MKPLSKLLTWVPDPLETPAWWKRQPTVQPNNENDAAPVHVPDEPENEAVPMNELDIQLGQHWGIVGATGSGKTVFTMKGLLEYLRRQFPHAKRYVLDSTDDPDMLAHVYNPLQVSGNTVPDTLHDPRSTLVWTPTNSKIPEHYNEWFNRLNDRREPQIVVIDEIASITGKALEGLEGLFKQLRKHGGTVVAETQEIAKVDTTIFRQLTHFVQFRINPETYDMTQARKYLGLPKEDYRQPRYDYGFFHRKTRGNYPMTEHQDYRQFFKL